MSEMESRVLALAARFGLSKEASQELVSLLSEIQESAGSAPGISSSGTRRSKTDSGSSGPRSEPGRPRAGQALPLLDRHGDPRPLGVGGMGEVFLVREKLLNRFVALKAVRPELGSKKSSIKRFL